jgi:hypothetical protein
VGDHSDKRIFSPKNRRHIASLVMTWGLESPPPERDHSKVGEVCDLPSIVMGCRLKHVAFLTMKWGMRFFYCREVVLMRILKHVQIKLGII